MARSRWIAAALLLLLAGASAAPASAFDYEDPTEVAEADVVVLTAANFGKVTTGTPFVLVEFYAPWCGHCKSLAPEYAAAATELKQQGAGPGIVLAKIDGSAPENSKLAKKHGVKSFPHLIWFKAGGEPVEYTGGRTRAELVSWVKKHTRPNLVELTDASEVAPFLPAKTGFSTSVVAYFPEGAARAAQVAAMEAVARAAERTFGWTGDATVAAALGLTVAAEDAPVVAMLRSFDEPQVVLLEALSQSSLTAFVANFSRPLLVTFSKATQPLIFEAAAQLLCFLPPGVEDEEAKAAVFAMHQAAAAVRGQGVQFVVVEANEESAPVLDFFGLGHDFEHLTVRAFQPKETRKSQPGPALAAGALNPAELVAFARSVLDGSAAASYKSAPAPAEEEQAGPLLRVVGTSFEQLVLRSEKDTFLYVFAPWCGVCKETTPVVEKLARRFASTPSVSIAVMDGAANEHPAVHVTGYPTIVFFAAGAKEKKGVLYESNDRSLLALTKWIKKHAAVPYELAKKTSKAEASHEELR